MGLVIAPGFNAVGIAVCFWDRLWRKAHQLKFSHISHVLACCMRSLGDLKSISMLISVWNITFGKGLIFPRKLISPFVTLNLTGTNIMSRSIQMQNLSIKHHAVRAEMVSSVSTTFSFIFHVHTIVAVQLHVFPWTPLQQPYFEMHIVASAREAWLQGSVLNQLLQAVFLPKDMYMYIGLAQLSACISILRDCMCVFDISPPGAISKSYSFLDVDSSNVCLCHTLTKCLC